MHAGGAARRGGCRDASTVGDERRRRRRHDDQLALPGRPDDDGGVRQGGQARSRGETLGNAAGGPAQGQLSPARLGHLAPALLGLPDPGHPLRGLRRRAGAGRPTCRCALPDDATFDKPGNPLDRHPTWKHVQCPKCGKPLRGARRTPWIRSSTAPGTSRASPTPMRTCRVDKDAVPTTGCRSTSTSAASSTRFCTCSIRASSTRAMRATGHGSKNLREPFAGLVHAGHGDPRDLQVPKRALALADGGQVRGSRATAAAPSRWRRASRSTSAPSRRCRSRRRTWSIPDDIIAQLGRRQRPLVHAVRQPARARRRLDGGRSPGRPAVHAAGLARSWTTWRTRRREKGTAQAGHSGAGGPGVCAARRTRRSHAVGQNIEGLRFNVAVAQIYEFTNTLSSVLAKAGADDKSSAKISQDLAWVLREAGELFVQMIAPMMPHLGGGVLGAARIQHLGRQSALAGGRCRRCSLTIRSPLPYR